MCYPDSQIGTENWPTNQPEIFYLTRTQSKFIQFFPSLFHFCLPFFSAKVQLENKKGHTALDVAKAYADPRVVAIVQKRWDEIPPPVDKKKRK